METIPILTVIDCQSILDKVGRSGTFDNPTSLGAWGTSDYYLYMMTTRSFVVSDQAQSELTVKAQVGQNIQWAITCIGAATNYNVILQKIVPNSQDAITNPQSLKFTLNQYGAHPNQTPTPSQVVQYPMDATVESTNGGSIQYYVTFSIVDPAGNTLGYYMWDPFINVTN